MINKLFRILKTFIGQIFPVKEVRAFIEKNKKVWSSYTSKCQDSKEYVLVDTALDHPAHNISHCIIANCIWREKALKPLYLLGSHYQRKRKQICQSYGSSDFVSDRASWKSLYLPGVVAKSVYEGITIFFNLENAKDILGIEYEGIKIGDLIYDTYLRKTGEGTINKKDIYLLYMTIDAIRKVEIYNQIFQKYDIRNAIVGHMVYNRLGVLSRVSLKQGATLYARKPGGNTFTIHKYGDYSQVMRVQRRPGKDLFRYVLNNKSNLAVKWAKNYLQRRITGDVDDEDAINAYNGKNISITDLVKDGTTYDPTRPTAVVMAHVFTDANHRPAEMLFRDYLTWFRNTLTKISKLDGVNWLVKKHPSEHLYNSKQSIAEEVNRICGNASNVCVVPETVNTKSIIDIADVGLTVCGSAGMEFPALGIPVILAGKSQYSGFGFTVEPSTVDKYKECLQNISDVEPLTERQIKRARVMVFIQYKLMQVEFDLVPNTVPSGQYNEKRAYLSAAEKLNNISSISNHPDVRTLERFVGSEKSKLIDVDTLGDNKDSASLLSESLGST